MSDELYAIYGASGHGRETMPLAREQLAGLGVERERLFFIDDGQSMPIVNGHQVLTYKQYLKMPASAHYVNIAIADSRVRETLATRCADDGILPWSVVARSTVVLDDVVLGDGAILSAMVTLTSNIRIGKHFHANIYSSVAHDCIIGDYVTFGPAVKCNGNIIVEDHAYIGTGAVLKQGKPGAPLIIGKGAIVGMGAVVTKSVEAGATVVGNPARRISNKA